MRGVTFLYLLYLGAPIVLLVVGSFGESWTNSLLPSGLTLRWYEEVFADPSFRRVVVEGTFAPEHEVLLRGRSRDGVCATASRLPSSAVPMPSEASSEAHDWPGRHPPRATSAALRSNRTSSSFGSTGSTCAA